MQYKIMDNYLLAMDMRLSELWPSEEQDYKCK